VRGRRCLSPETIEEYRRLTPGERLTITFKMMRDAAQFLKSGPPDVLDRKFELIRRENDARTENMLRGLALTKE
jgi:hypothetical protein